MALTPPSGRSVRREAAPVDAPGNASRCATTSRSPVGASSFIAVTRRPAVRLRMAVVSGTVGLPAPTFYERLDDVPAAGNDAAVVVLDLGCCCMDTGLQRLVRRWVQRCPGTELVLFTPLLDRELELATALALLRTVGGARLRVMTASDFYCDEIWRALAALRLRVVLARELCAEFLAAIERTGRSLRAAEAVLALLAKAPGHAAIDDRLEALLASREPSAAHVGSARLASERYRKARWKQLHRDGQMPASRLLLVFRVLWFAKLRHVGWPTAHVAELLDFASAREFRRAIRRRLGVGVRVLRRVSYEDALDWAAQLVVAEHAPPGSTRARLPTGALLLERSP